MGERHLRLVDTETGEVIEDADACPGCAERDDVIAGLERDIRGWAIRYRNLERDLERDARASDLWAVGERLFSLWRRATGRTRARFSYDRFALLEPFIRDAAGDDFSDEPGPPSNQLEEAAAAIIGRADDHYTTTRSNGTVKHFDEWERIFKNRGEYEDSRDRRPRDWRERFRQLDKGWEQRWEQQQRRKAST